MLSLKRITLALGGLIATIFGGGLLGVHAGPAAVEPGDVHRELEAKGSVSVPALGAPQESKPDATPTHSKPDFASTDLVAGDTRIEFERIPRLLARMPDRLPDWRRSLLVGVVELRI